MLKSLAVIFLVLVLFAFNLSISSGQIEWAEINAENAANLVALATIDVGDVWGISYNSMAFSPDGSRLAVATLSGLRVFDVSGGEEPISVTENLSITAVFSPDGSQLAAFGLFEDDYGLFIVDTEEFDTELFLDFGPQILAGMSYSPDGSVLAYTSNEFVLYDNNSGMQNNSGRIDVIDAESGDEVYSESDSNTIVGRVFFSVDGSTMIYSSWDQPDEYAENDWVIHFVDTETWEENDTLEVAGAVTAVSPDWTLFSLSNTIRAPQLLEDSIGTFYPRGSDAGIIEVETGDEAITFERGSDSTNSSLDFFSSAFSLDGSLLVASESGQQSSVIHLWDTDELSEVSVIELDRDQTHEVLFSPDGTVLAALTTGASSTTSTVQLWGALPPGICTVTAINTANLRGGPSTNDERVGTLAAGEDAYVNGQVTDSGDYVWFQLITGAWVRSDLVTTSGDCENVPTVEAP